MKTALNLVPVILPVSLIVGGYLIGLIIDQIILKRLRKVSARTKWGGDDIILTAFDGIPTLWFFLAGFYAAVLNTPLSPYLLSIIQRVLLIITIFSVTMIAARVAVGFIRLYGTETEGGLPSSTIFVNITRIVIFLTGFLTVLQSLDISVTPILTALGVGGLAVALALQEPLSNLFSGLQLIASQQLKIGDFIRLDTGDEGVIRDIAWRSTTILTLPANIIIVPNHKLATMIIRNYHMPDTEMVLVVQVGVGYSSDLQKVEQVTIDVGREIMREVPGGVADFEPQVRYHTFANYSINFSVVLRVKEFVDQYLIQHEFVKRLHKRYAKENIEIPFPITTLRVKGIVGDAPELDGVQGSLKQVFKV